MTSYKQLENWVDRRVEIIGVFDISSDKAMSCRMHIMKNLLAAIAAVSLVGCGSSQDTTPEIAAGQAGKSEEGLNGVSEALDGGAKPGGGQHGPRWPSRSEGQWIDAGEERLLGLQLSDVRFVPMQPLPDWGYVAVESMGPTVRASLHNATRFEIAEVRIRVQAVGELDGVIVAEEVTDTPGKYFSSPPNTTSERKFLLADDGAFAGSPAWPAFKIEITIQAVRIWSETQSELDPIER